MIQNSFYLEIKAEAIEHNINLLKAWKGKSVIPVIKANAYGHGIVYMALECMELGIELCAVARCREALRVLRDPRVKAKLAEGKKLQLLVFESIRDFALLREEEGIDLAVNSFEELKKALAEGIPASRIQVKLDFAFARNGVPEEEHSELADYILEEDLHLKGIYTHLFSVSYQDGLDIISKISLFLDKIGRERVERVHLQNSAGCYNYDCEDATDLRVGMLVYGLQEPGYYHAGLEQALALKGRVDGLATVEESRYIAYEEKKDLELGEGMKIAKIKIGYADGFGKHHENTSCLIRHKEYRIVQVTMDNSFVEVDDRVKIGDDVELLYKVDNLKLLTGSNLHEELTLLAERLPRIWRKKN